MVIPVAHIPTSAPSHSSQMVDLAVDCGNTHRAFKSLDFEVNHLPPKIYQPSESTHNNHQTLCSDSHAKQKSSLLLSSIDVSGSGGSTMNSSPTAPETMAPETMANPKSKPPRMSGRRWELGGMVTVAGPIFSIEDKLDGSIKDHGTFKVDVIKSIGELGKELRKSINDGNAGVHQEVAGIHQEFAGVHQKFAGIHQEFTELKSDQKLMKWQLHFLFFGTSSLVLWTIKDYIQLRFPAFFDSEERTPPHKQPEAPQKKLQK